MAVLCAVTSIVVTTSLPWRVMPLSVSTVLSKSVRRFAFEPVR